MVKPTDLKREITAAEIEIGDFLKDIRQENNLTQKEAAAMMNVSLRAYQQYENGLIDITMEKMLRFIYKLKTKGAVAKLQEKFLKFRI